jgi:hypothetical protein
MSKKELYKSKKARFELAVMLHKMPESMLEESQELE